MKVWWSQISLRSLLTGCWAISANDSPVVLRSIVNQSREPLWCSAWYELEEVVGAAINLLYLVSISQLFWVKDLPSGRSETFLSGYLCSLNSISLVVSKSKVLLKLSWVLPSCSSPTQPRPRPIGEPASQSLPWPSSQISLCPRFRHRFVLTESRAHGSLLWCLKDNWREIVFSQVPTSPQYFNEYG